MPQLNRVARLVRLATLPETRRAVLAVAHSPALRDIAQRASTDRAGLLRDLKSPAHARGLIRDAVRHPVTRELADASLMFLPVRYLPIGWAASRAARRVLRRYIDPPSEVIDPSAFGAARPLKNVTDAAPPGPEAAERPDAMLPGPDAAPPGPEPPDPVLGSPEDRQGS